MSLEEVGEVRYSAPNVINWIIPSFSLLSRKKDTRIWSPSFSHCDDDGNSGRVPWVPPGFLGLILRSEDGKETPVQCVRFGIADMKNSEICCCDGVWRTGLFIRHFRVSKFVSKKILKGNWNFFKEKPRFRLFCVAVHKQRCQVVNACTQTENPCATASSVSSTAAANIEENWKCRLCTLINPADASNCEACHLRKSSNLRKSLKDKKLGSSENLIPPFGNPATNLPLCIICINKERDIVFQPCGHLITCSDCADFRMSYCPLCRKDIQNKLKTFIN